MADLSLVPDDNGLASGDILDMVKPTIRDGVVQSTSASLLNIHTILAYDPRWKDRIALNAHDERIYIDGDRPITDTVETEITIWLQDVYQMKQASTKKVHEVCLVIGKENAYHPVRDWLESLQWDGQPRADKLLSRYASAEDTPVHDEYSRRFLISCVARVIEPGCQVDTVLILQGAQGARKTSFFRELGGQWYSEAGIDLRDFKQSAEQIEGVWIYELGELDSMRRSEATAVKAFVTRRVDEYRPAYGRNRVSKKRQTVFVGTTNEEAFLTDSTGNRRYWPVRVGAIDIASLRRDREQLFAEALQLYRDGEPWWLSEEAEAARRESLEQFEAELPWEREIEEWLQKNLGRPIRCKEIAEGIGLDVKDRHSGTYRKIATVLGSERFGLRPGRKGGVRCWVRREDKDD